MIALERIKPLLVHPAKWVRYEAMRYFREGMIFDPEIVPRALEARDRYGVNATRGIFIDLDRQPIDAAAWVAILERLHSAKNTEEIQDLNDILRWAPLPLLEERFGALEQAGGKVTKPTLDFAHKRLEFAGKDQPTLWNELLAFAAEADAKARYVTDLDRDGADILIEALARHDRPTATEMIELIGDYQKEEWFEKDYWLHCLYVDLIGERRMREMIPTLVDFFHLDADYLRERTQLALARMRDSEAVRLVRQAFPHETWEYCNYAVEVLGQSRVPEAEPAILELLEQVEFDNEDILFEFEERLVVELCDQFSPEAIPWCRRMIADGRGEAWDDLRKLALCVAEAHGIELEEKEAWWRAVDAEERRIDAFTYGIPAVERANEEGDRAKEERLARRGQGPQWGEAGKTAPPYGPVETFRRERPKIGPNQPCPCGSGKKYKKCCGRKG